MLFQIIGIGPEKGVSLMQAAEGIAGHLPFHMRKYMPAVQNLFKSGWLDAPFRCTGGRLPFIQLTLLIRQLPQAGQKPVRCPFANSELIPAG